jgi:hypothetical protein
VREICLEHAIESLAHFPSFGDATPLRSRVEPSRPGRRFAAAFLIWAMGFLSVSSLLSFAHHGVSSKTQPDSWVCKRH